ncbi:hypothetical protein TNCV_989401 [Trichonephila clavipes]|nr:hypothetical protein TNCV_989401 [Trichonephila clavipes]
MRERIDTSRDENGVSGMDRSMRRKEQSLFKLVAAVVLWSWSRSRDQSITSSSSGSTEDLPCKDGRYA